MAGPICLMWRNRPKEAWFELSEEERNAFFDKVIEAHEKVGSERIVALDAHWATEEWRWAGVTEFPDVDALQKYGDLLLEIDHDRYFLVECMLGTKWEEPS